jgi:RND family efflux transporter MFP subunit
MTQQRDQQRLRLRAALPFASFLFAAVVVGLTGPAAAQQTPTASPSDRKEGPAQMRLVVPGTIQAYYATDLYAKDSGYISQIHADIGDQVKKNQVMAVIDDPELQQQLLRSRAAVQQAAASLEVAKRRLTGLQADRTLQQATLKRSEQLFAGKAVTGQQLDEQRAKEGVSAANLGVGQAEVVLAEANLQAANADLQRLLALVEYTKIVAPFDGVITRRLINVGDLVQAATSTRPATPLFTCQEIDVVRVFADVPETNAAAIRPGWTAEVQLYGPTGQTVRNTVTRIASALDPTTRTMRIEIDLRNPDGSLLPGMYAQVTLSSPNAAEAQTTVGSK